MNLKLVTQHAKIQSFAWKRLLVRFSNYSAVIA